MYFYIFVLPDHQNDANVNSERPATLEARKNRGGEPLMDPQSVADRTQAYANG
jgi:hypothetical protein